MSLVQLCADDTKEPVTFSYFNQPLKERYRKPTKYAMTLFPHQFNSLDFGYQDSITISRQADMIKQMYLSIVLPELPENVKWVPNIGIKLIENIRFLIGGSYINCFGGDFIHIYNKLHNPKLDLYLKMINDNKQVTIPLHFIQHYLPLISLPYHQVNIEVRIRNLFELLEPSKHIPGLRLGQTDILVNSIMLDEKERREIAGTKHDMFPVKQVKSLDEIVKSGNWERNYIFHRYYDTFVDIFPKDLVNIIGSYLELNNSPVRARIRLNFRLMCSQLIWVVDDAGEECNPIEYCQLRISEQDRFGVTDKNYFTKIQSFQHNENYDENINSYSFCVNPYDSFGGLNFNRINDSVLELELVGIPKSGCYRIRVYAIVNNDLRVMSGMAGLRISN